MVRRLRFGILLATLCLVGAGAGAIVAASGRSGAPPVGERNALFAVLSGGNVVMELDGPLPVGIPAPRFTFVRGDPDGWGSATAIVPSRGVVCVSVLMAGIDRPTSVQLHRGRAGTNGPVVATLDLSGSGDPGNASGCVPLAENDLSAIRLDPTSFYIDVYTREFATGAIRGQLF